MRHARRWACTEGEGRPQEGGEGRPACSSSSAVATTVTGGASALLSGAFVPNVPTGAGIMVLSLMGTTAIPLNIFLSSACAEGYSLSGMRRGIACATLLTCVLSMTIVIVGSGVSLQSGA